MTRAENQDQSEYKIKVIENLLAKITSVKSLANKLDCISSQAYVQEFLTENPSLASYILKQPVATKYLLYAILAIGEGPGVFQNWEISNETAEPLIAMLTELEAFYSGIGGIIGYHLATLKLLQEKRQCGETLSSPTEKVFYYQPEGLDCAAQNNEARKKIAEAVRYAIEHMPEVAEVYPIGGAGERLNLLDPVTQEPLPAMELKFCGRTLLEGLIRDLQGREYLHYKLCGKQVTTPIAAMTSHEKNNDKRVRSICESAGWFGRGRSSFRFFIQPQVPMLTLDGHWAIDGPLKPIVRPGGHGVIWKCAKDQGVFDWLQEQNYSKAIIRQINNPIAGIDNGLLVLAGIGLKFRKSFGFASCNRVLGSSEGMDVLCEKQTALGTYAYCITNVEYTDFAQRGLQDEPCEAGGRYSRFPCNTNILYADIPSVRAALEVCPIPGMLINTKSKVDCFVKGEFKSGVQVCRLESTMQNIADVLVDVFHEPIKIKQQSDLKTFITFNDRLKTISVAKQAYNATSGWNDTPENCYYDLMRNYAQLLKHDCQMSVPELEFGKEPSFEVLFHPALGGLFEIISQKIRFGRISIGSEWEMEVVEAYVEELDLDGSLIVHAVDAMGPRDKDGKTVFDSERAGKCVLKNVKVKNRGIKRGVGGPAWKREVTRDECMEIIIHGNGEFHAEDVVLEGGGRYNVPSGERWVVMLKEGKLFCDKQKISKATWRWSYTFDESNAIKLKK